MLENNGRKKQFRPQVKKLILYNTRGLSLEDDRRR